MTANDLTVLYKTIQVAAIFFFFFFNDTATTEIYTLSLQRRSSDLDNLLQVGASGFEPPTSWSRTRRRSEEHTSELQSQSNLVCRLLLEKKKKTNYIATSSLDHQ